MSIAVPFDVHGLAAELLRDEKGLSVTAEDVASVQFLEPPQAVITLKSGEVHRAIGYPAVWLMTGGRTRPRPGE